MAWLVALLVVLWLIRWWTLPLQVIEIVVVPEPVENVGWYFIGGFKMVWNIDPEPGDQRVIHLIPHDDDWICPECEAEEETITWH